MDRGKRRVVLLLSNFELIASYRNPYLRHCHEICIKDQLLFLTSTGFDSLLVFHLESREFIWGLYLSKNGQEWIGQRFDPRTKGGPPFVNNYHINMVIVNDDGVYFSGLNTGALLALSSKMGVTEYCSLPKGCHNARPHLGGVLFNDTRSDVVRYVARQGQKCRGCGTHVSLQTRSNIRELMTQRSLAKALGAGFA